MSYANFWTWNGQSAKLPIASKPCSSCSPSSKTWSYMVLASFIFLVSYANFSVGMVLRGSFRSFRDHAYRDRHPLKPNPSVFRDFQLKHGPAIGYLWVERLEWSITLEWIIESFWNWLQSKAVVKLVYSCAILKAWKCKTCPYCTFVTHWWRDILS